MTLERAPQLQSLRQLVRKIDNLVIGELRKRDPYLKFVEERSDPMLAIYPADGAGFKRHVDNSAGDGRVLTVVSSDALLAIAIFGHQRLAAPGRVTSTRRALRKIRKPRARRHSGGAAVFLCPTCPPPPSPGSPRARRRISGGLQSPAGRDLACIARERG